MKRFLFLLIAGLLALLIAACGNNGAADTPGGEQLQDAGNPVNNQANRARANVQADPVSFLLGLTGDMYSSVLGNVKESTNVISGITKAINDGTTGRISTSFSLNINQREINRLEAEFPELGEIIGLVSLLANSGFNMEILYNTGGNQLLGALNLNWLVNNQRLLGFESVLANNRVFLGIPELYDRYIAVEAPFFSMMPDQAGFMDALDPLVELLTKHERTLDHLLNGITRAALAEITRITVNNNVTVTVNGRPVRYTEMVVSLTETELANAARAAIQVLKDDNAAIDMIVDFADILMLGIDAQTVRDMLDEVIDEFDPAFFDDTVLFEVQIYLDADTNEFTGFQTEFEGILFKLFFDFGHGYEFVMIEEGMWPSHLILRGDLNGRLNDFSGDMWIEYADRWEQFSGRLGAFEVRYTDWDRFSVQLSANVGDWLQIAGVNPLEELPGILAEYVNNAEIVLVMDVAPNAARFALEVTEPVNGLSAKLEMTVEENVRVNINLPSNTIGLDEMDVLLGRDLFVILGNVANLIGQLEAMGYDVSMLDSLLAGMLW
jgi:hypothetical protein